MPGPGPGCGLGRGCAARLSRPRADFGYWATCEGAGSWAACTETATCTVTSENCFIQFQNHLIDEFCNALTL